MYSKAEINNNEQINKLDNNLSVIEIKLEKQHKEFNPFLSELLNKIDSSIESLVNQPNYSPKNPVMIVSHEYLYGYDHYNQGATAEELKEYERALQSKVEDIAKKYSIDISIAPGTIVLQGDRANQVSNRAYFFTPGTETKYTDKAKAYADLFDWNGKKVFVSVCCNWNTFKYHRPDADIYFIPSSGYFFLSDKASGSYAGTGHEIINKPGAVFINSEQRFVDRSGVYHLKDSALHKNVSLCLDPEHFQHIDKREPIVLSDYIKISEVQMGPGALIKKQLAEEKIKADLICVEDHLELYETQSQDLLEQLERIKDSLVRTSKTNSQYKMVAERVTKLYDTLNQEMTLFFVNPTASSFQLCHKICKEAIKNATEEAEKHRGWHAINPILRGILGVLAAISVLPALMVELKSKHGYVHTFFARPVTPTSEKLAVVTTQFDQQKTDFEIQNNILSAEIRGLGK